MKKVLSITSAVLLLSLSVKADLITVTANGTIYETDCSLPGTNYSAKNVNYTFLFDTKKDGFYIYNGKIIKYADYNYSSNNFNENKDYFYADFLGVCALPDYGITRGVTEYNDGSVYVVNSYGITNITTVLFGGSTTHFVEIYNYDNDISNWKVEDKIFGYEYSEIDNNYNNVRAYSKLTITTLSKTPVPDPSVFSMMFCGITLLGAFGFLKRREIKAAK